MKVLTISVARQGSSSAFQITVHKNLNGFHRVEGIESHTSLKAPVSRKISYVFLFPPSYPFNQR